MHRSFLPYNVARYFICICLAIRKMTATMMMVISAIIIMFNFKKRIQSVSDHRRFSVHAAACLCVMMMMKRRVAGQPNNLYCFDLFWSAAVKSRSLFCTQMYSVVESAREDIKSNHWPSARFSREMMILEARLHCMYIITCLMYVRCEKMRLLCTIGICAMMK